MRMTSKGQVTVPQDVRRKYGLGPGDEVRWIPSEQGPVLIRASKAPPGRGIIDRMQHGGRVKGTTAEILKLTRIIASKKAEARNALQRHIRRYAGSWSGSISGKELLKRTRP